MTQIAVITLLTTGILLVPVSHGLLNIGRNIQTISENSTIEEKWKFYENRFKNLTNTILDEIILYVIKTASTEKFKEINVTSQCTKDLFHILAGLKSMKTWAFRFPDASGKIADGMLHGAVNSLGSYTECLQTQVLNEGRQEKQEIRFSGKYCNINIKASLPPEPRFYKLTDQFKELSNLTEEGTLFQDIADKAILQYVLPMRVGICVPSSCSSEDVNQTAKFLGKKTALDMYATTCHTNDDVHLTQVQIFIMAFFGFTLSISFLGTLFDVYLYYRGIVLEDSALQFLLAFSVLRNAKTLLNTPKDPGALQCLHGIRFLTMSWMLVAHVWLMIWPRIYSDVLNVLDQTKDFALQPIINGSLAVDTFFCMGGLLVSFHGINAKKNQNRPFKLHYAVLKRIFRIIPVYVYIIMLFFLVPLLPRGPLWPEVSGKYMGGCDKNWWTNLLFINNILNTEDMCFVPSWYIACDFQLFLVGIIVLPIFFRWPNVGLLVSVLLIITCVYYSGLITYFMKFPPTILFINPDEEQRVEYYVKYYFLPMTHLGPYFVGFILGYILVENPARKIRKSRLVMGWIVAITIGISTLYGIYPWSCGEEMTLLETSLYAALFRNSWAISLAWVILCCCKGYGGFVNSILSWKVFVPLSRLTFIVYLIQSFVYTYFAGQIRTQIQMDYFMQVWFFAGALLISYSLAFIGNIVVEGSAMSIEKLILR